MQSSLATTLYIILSLFLESVSPTLFRATGLSGFDVEIDIGDTETTVTASVSSTQALVWHGIGFGRNQMRDCYSIIETPGSPPTFVERLLARSNGNDGALEGKLLNATAANWITSFDASSDPYIITMTRDNDVGGGDYYTFDPTSIQLRIIYTIGSGAALTDGHGSVEGTDYIWETLNEIPTTTAPTAAPTVNTVPPTTATSSPTSAPINTATTPIVTTATPIDTTITPIVTTATPIVSTATPADTNTIATTHAIDITTTDTADTVTTSSISSNNTTTGVITTNNVAETTTVYTTMNEVNEETTESTASDTMTIVLTTDTEDTDDISGYASGISGYIERTEDWVNKEASQFQLLLVCGGFALLLIILLVCCYSWQNKKTKKLQKTLYQFDPEFLQNERAKKNGKKEKKDYGDIPYVDAEDPDSSIGDHHDPGVALAAVHADDIDIPPPNDNEANFRRSNPNAGLDIEHQLEESLSVSQEDIGMLQGVNDVALDVFTGNMNEAPAAPPPPLEPIPSDILEAHRARAATTQQYIKPNTLIDRRSSYHPVADVSGVPNEVELEAIDRDIRIIKPIQRDNINVIPSAIERVKTVSHVVDDDDDPPTPIYDDEHNNIMISERDLTKNMSREHHKMESLQNIRDKQLSKSRVFIPRNDVNDAALFLLTDDREKVEQDIDQKGVHDEFDALSSSSSKMLFQAKDNNKIVDIEAQFRALSNANPADNDMVLAILDVNDDDDEDIQQSEAKIAHKAVQSGDDVILDIFSAKSVQEDEVIAQHRGKQAVDDPFASLHMDPNDLFVNKDNRIIVTDKPIPEPVYNRMQSGNDIVLGLFEGTNDDSNPHVQKAYHNDVVVLEERKEAPKVETEVKLLDIEAQHRGKQVDDDPFASLEMSPNNLFTMDKSKEKGIDSEAMGFVDGLMAANPEFGDNNNIFGVSDIDNNVSAVLNASGTGASNFVDFNKYTNVPETVPIDYSKLTQITDKDQYKVVSVYETVEIKDNDGNIHKEENEQSNDIHVISGDLDRIEAELNGIDDSDNVVSSDLNRIESELNGQDSDDEDPFAPLNNDPFAQINSKIEQKEDIMNNDQAMGFVDGLMAANPEFGDNNNIFGVSDIDNNVATVLNASGAGASNFVDFNKYTNVPATVPIDYSKLTQITDEDQYKVVSVYETVEIEDNDGNIHKIKENEQSNDINVISGDLDRIEAELNAADDYDKDSDDEDPFHGGVVNDNRFSSPLDSIMNESQNVHRKEDEFEVFSSPLDAIMNSANDDEDNVDKNIKHKTIDLDEYMAASNAPIYDIQQNVHEIKEDVEDDDDEDEDEYEDDEDDVESLGSEIIHESPRNSARRIELDPQIFGDDGDSSTDESQY